MKKSTTLILLLLIGMINAQTQIGNNIIPTINAEGSGNNVSVSADGNRVLFGSRLTSINGNDFAGAARVYQNNNGTWEQLGQVLEGENELQFFGETLTMSNDGNRIAIGSRDYLKIYAYNGTTWQSLGQELTVTNISRTREVAFSEDGNIVAVVFQLPSFGSAIQVHSFNGNIWEQMGTTFSETSSYDISLSDLGTRLAITFEITDDETKVFDYTGSSWVQIGQSIPLVTNYYPEKIQLSGDGSRLLIFSADNANTALNGFLSTYDLVNGTWTLSTGQLNFIEENPYGISLSTSTDGNRVAVGTSDDNYFDDYNSVQVFEVVNNTWEQVGAEIQIWSHDEQTPNVVSMTPDGSKVAISSLLSAPNVEEGLIRVFNYDEELSDFNDIDLKGLSVYPNPTEKSFKIDLGKNYLEVNTEITNSLGQVIASHKFKNIKVIPLQIEGATGVYFITVTTNEGVSKVLKIIKQ